MNDDLIYVQERSITWIYDNYELGRIVEAPFQRDNGLWTDDMKELFIDSIFSGYLTQPIYLGCKEQEDKNLYCVIDGLQRIKVIYDFINDKITYNNKHYGWLESYQKGKFCDYSLRVYEISTKDNSKLFDYFCRLNSIGKIIPLKKEL